MAILILLAVAILTIALIVIVTARDNKFVLLAVVGLLSGLAIVVVALPVNGKNGGGDGTK
jgi:hypothetical protein